jgi:uncharacterized protein DUF402
VSAGTIIERKRRLDGTSVEFVCDRSLVLPGERAVLRYVIERDRPLEGTDLVLPAGTVTIAHYWVDRPYNVYHWTDRGRTLGYYCNVATDTRIAPDVVSYTDLVVDVLIDTAGRALVLDEDELPTDVAPTHRRTIARALDQLTSQPGRLAREIETGSAPYR